MLPEASCHTTRRVITSSNHGSKGATWLPAGEAIRVIRACGKAARRERKAGESITISPMLSTRTANTLRTSDLLEKVSDCIERLTPQEMKCLRDNIVPGRSRV